MLGLVVTDYLYRTYPDMPEGELAKVRASVVNSAALAELAAELDIGDAILLGKGEDQSGGRQKPSILADAMEALIGAVYLDQGWSGSERMVMRLLGDRIESAAAGPGGQDYKTRLQELSARCYRAAARLPGERRGSRPRQGVPRGRARPGPGSGGGPGPLQEAGRAGRGPGRVGGPDRRAQPGHPGRVWTGARPVPELPEVETIRRDIDKEFVSKRIRKVEVTGARSVRRHDNPQEFVARVEGRTMTGDPTAREVPPVEARQRRRPGRPHGHERTAAARQSQGSAG